MDQRPIAIAIPAAQYADYDDAPRGWFARFGLRPSQDQRDVILLDVPT